MADAARRMGHGHNSDVVRRLLARPIRLQAAPARVAAEPELDIAAEPVEAAPRPETTSAGVVTAAPRGDAERLRTEVLLLKAVLRAERRENESLRACVGFEEAGADLTPEARAMRDRWAALVDRLLHAPA